MSILRPSVLLLSNKFDYPTDYVAYRLKELDVPYIRLNRDSFHEMELSLELSPAVLRGKLANVEFELHESNLRSVYFRAPVFLRDNCQPGISPDEQFSRSQWAAFLRSLTVFSTARWLNHPKHIYQAEIKPYQLAVASRLGFKIPDTLITNSATSCISRFSRDQFVVKTLDSVVLQDGEEEGFIYTSLVAHEEITHGSIRLAPIIAQTALIPKIDLRVSVVGDRAFPVSITAPDGQQCPIDWRLKKDGLCYQRHELPPAIERACVDLVQQLGLNFGGIDLVYCKNEYWFIEVNPTGEWSWLMEPTGYEIDLSLAKWLAEP